MKKYFFVSFNYFIEKRHVGCGGLIVVCSCSLERIGEALLDYYNGFASNKGDKGIITGLTGLDRQTAAELS